MAKCKSAIVSMMSMGEGKGDYGVDLFLNAKAEKTKKGTTFYYCIFPQCLKL